jgi:hypothetical protein
MPFVHRRTFVGKVGKGFELIEHAQELIDWGEDASKTLRTKFKARVLSDFMSGRSDRIVLEIELDDLMDMNRFMDEELGTATGRKFFEPWFAKLTTLIEYAEVENWQVHDTGPTLPVKQPAKATARTASRPAPRRR